MTIARANALRRERQTQRALPRRRAGAGASRPGGVGELADHRSRCACSMSPLLSQQAHRVSHAKAGDVGRHVREPAAALRGSQIDVNPGHCARHEAVQKARRENVIALAVRARIA